MVSIAMHICISVVHANRKTGEKLSGNEAKLTWFSDHIVILTKLNVNDEQVINQQH